MGIGSCGVSFCAGGYIAGVVTSDDASAVESEHGVVIAAAAVSCGFVEGDAFSVFVFS